MGRPITFRAEQNPGGPRNGSRKVPVGQGTRKLQYSRFLMAESDLKLERNRKVGYAARGESNPSAEAAGREP